MASLELGGRRFRLDALSNIATISAATSPNSAKVLAPNDALSNIATISTHAPTTADPAFVAILDTAQLDRSGCKTLARCAEALVA